MKRVVFILHNLFRFVTLYGWIIDKRVLYLQGFVLISWYFNNNKCIVSQIEKRLFGETFQKNNSVYVNKYHRLELCLLFSIGNLFWHLN